MRKSVFVIGNGFDLGMGLKTSYENFVEDDLFKYRCSKFGASIFTFIDSRARSDKWIDLERLIGEYANKNEKDFFKELQELKKCLAEWLNKSIRKLSESEIDKSVPFNYLMRHADEESTFITFNYTHVLHDVIEIVKKRKTIKGKMPIIEVHGGMANQFKDIVFGVDDAFVCQKTHHEYIYKSANSNRNWIQIQAVLNAASDFHWYGHSLGETDKSYFQDFFHVVGGNSTHVSGKSYSFCCFGISAYYALSGNIRTLYLRDGYRAMLFNNELKFKDITAPLASWEDGDPPLILNPGGI